MAEVLNKWIIEALVIHRSHGRWGMVEREGKDGSGREWKWFAEGGWLGAVEGYASTRRVAMARVRHALKKRWRGKARQ